VNRLRLNKDTIKDLNRVHPDQLEVEPRRELPVRQIHIATTRPAFEARKQGKTFRALQCADMSASVTGRIRGGEL